MERQSKQRLADLVEKNKIGGWEADMFRTCLAEFRREEDRRGFLEIYTELSLSVWLSIYSLHEQEKPEARKELLESSMENNAHTSRCCALH